MWIGEESGEITMLKIKKSIIAVSVLTTFLSINLLNASANSPATHGRLHMEYHYVPIFKDYACGSTDTNIGYNGNNVNQLWVKTTVKVTNKSGDTVTEKSEGYGNDALEGKKSATAKIRNIKKANGTHSGGCKNGPSATTYTSHTR